MATKSGSLALGTALPPTRLVDVVSGEPVDVGGPGVGRAGVLVMFICNHCPYVVHIRHELVRVGHEALDRGIAVLAINSNDAATYPQDGPDAMRRLATEEHWRFPFLFDSTQDVARAFGAECTPDLYVFDADRRLAYHGQFDDSRPANGKPLNGKDLRAALDAVVSGKKPVSDQKPSIGCGIKWRKE